MSPLLTSSRLRVPVALLLACLLAVSAVAPALASRAAPSTLQMAATPRYAITELGGSGEARAINRAGQVAGWSSLDSSGAYVGMHAALWTSGGLPADLGTLPGYDSSDALGLNDVGQVVGYSTSNTMPRVGAFLGTPGGGMTDLGTLGGDFSYAHDVSNAGQVVGASRTAGGSYRAFLWTAGEGMADLGALPGDTDSYAHAISEAGQVVGYSLAYAGSELSQRAFIWKASGGMAELGMPPGYKRSIARAISDAGHVVGFAGSHAFLWTAGGMADLGALPGYPYSSAYGVNAAGQVVGTSYTGDGSSRRAFLWTPGGGMIDLTSLLPAGSGWVLEWATGINAAGQITGTGSRNGQRAAFLLTPATAPGACLTVGPAPTFPDVPASHPYYEAITELAARGVIRGYQDGRFGPDDTTLRAQMAALIARAMCWDLEDHDNPFPDQGSVDADLWRNVGTLAHYDVARGYEDGTYKPTDPVLYAQVISFITRAMVTEGYWQQETVDTPGLYPNVSVASGHRWDLLTYHKHAGAIPGTTPTASWGAWDRPATRGWFAEALWQALTTDR